MYNYTDWPFVKKLQGARIIKGLTLFNVVQIILFATIYFSIASQTSHTLYFVPPVSIVWSLPGISLAFLLLFGINLWPGIFIGSLLHQISIDSLTKSFILSLSRTVEAVSITFLLTRYLHLNYTLGHIRDVAILFLSILMGGVFSATIAISILYLNGYEANADSIKIWLGWCFSHITSEVVFVPFLLVWFTKADNQWFAKLRQHYKEAFILVFSGGLASYTILVSDNSILGGLKYLIFLFVIWSSVRFTQRGVTFMLLIIESAAILSSASGVGIFSAELNDHNITLLEVFIITVVFTGMFLAASVNERIEVERNLLASKMKVKLILNHSLYSIITIDDRGIIKEWNKQAENMFGWSENESIGKDLVKLITPKVPDNKVEVILYNLFEDVDRNRLNESIEVMVQNKAGKIFPVEVTYIHHKIAEKDYYTIFIHSLAEQVMISEMKELLSEVVESSDDAIITKTLDGTIITWNHSAEQLFGYSADEVIGKNIQIIIPHERRKEEKEILAKIKGGEHIRHYETVRVAKDGHRVKISLSISPVHDQTGQIVGAAKIARVIKQSAGEIRNAA